MFYFGCWCGWLVTVRQLLYVAFAGYCGVVDLVCFVIVVFYVGFCLIVLGAFIGYRRCGFMAWVLYLQVLLMFIWACCLLFRVVVGSAFAVCGVGFRARCDFFLLVVCL